jgi:hypothetical protein
VNPAGYCGAPLVALSAEWLIMLSSPRHQSVVDWVAGIVTVRD